VKRLLGAALRKAGRILVDLGERVGRRGSALRERGTPRSLYRIPEGDLLWLNETGYLDQQLIRYGTFEPDSTTAIGRLVKSGQTALDVGANIGYYTVRLSKLVGPEGRVIAFEPTAHFLDVLKRNIAANGLDNVEVHNVGLSDKAGEQVIDIGPSSATMHSPPGFDKVLSTERIRLTTLSEFVDQTGLARIDFIKIDVDGHEPRFFEGAWPVLDRLSPVILCEVSHLHYLEAGYTAWDFYASAQEHGYRIYDEITFEPFVTREDFLRRCGNFNASANVILSKAGLPPARA